MDIKQLEAFLALVDHDTMQDAAKSIDLSQPSTSLRLQQLEKSLGHDLFSRDNRSLSLTDHGRALIPYARQILQLRQEASLAVESAEDTEHNALQLFVTDTAILAFIQFIVKQLNLPADYLTIDLIQAHEIPYHMRLTPQALFITHTHLQLDNIRLYLDHRVTHRVLFDSHHPLAQLNRMLTALDLVDYPRLDASDLPTLNWQSKRPNRIPAISLPHFLVGQNTVAILPHYLVQIYTEQDHIFASETLDTSTFDLPSLKLYLIASSHLSLTSYQKLFLDLLRQRLS